MLGQQIIPTWSMPIITLRPICTSMDGLKVSTFVDFIRVKDFIRYFLTGFGDVDWFDRPWRDMNIIWR